MSQSTAEQNTNSPIRFFLPMLSAIVAIVPFAIDTYLPAMTQIAKELGSDMGMMQLTLSLFLAGYAAGLLVFGAITDIVGRRPIMLCGLAGFAVCSLLLANTENIGEFLFLRLLQAFVGAGATVPVSGYVKAIYGKNMAKGMSYVSMIMMLAPMVAPTIGVLILGLDGWRLIFIVLGLYGLLMLTFAFLYLPKAERKTLDDSLFNTMFKSYRIVLAEKSIRRYIFVVAFATFSFFGYLTAIPFVYMEYYGVSESMFGILFAFNVAFLIVGGFINTRLVPRLGSLRMVKGALVIVVISSAALFTVNYLELHLYWTVGLLALFLSSTLVLSTNADSLILLAFSEQTGTATGVIGVLRFGFGALSGPFLVLLHDGTSMAYCYMVAFCVTGICCSMLIPAKTTPSER